MLMLELSQLRGEVSIYSQNSNRGTDIYIYPARDSIKFKAKVRMSFG